MALALKDLFLYTGDMKCPARNGVILGGMLGALEWSSAAFAKAPQPFDNPLVIVAGMVFGGVVGTGLGLLAGIKDEKETGDRAFNRDDLYAGTGIYVTHEPTLLRRGTRIVDSD